MMRSGQKILVLLVVLLLPLVVFAAEEQGSAPPQTVCLQCHGGLQGHLSAPVGQWSKSIHRQNNISCHDCHGGDPTDFAMAMSPERGFLGVPAKDDIPDFCGRCHIGVKEDYASSKHGQALGKGGPQCVTCHGNHEVSKASIDLINEQDCTRCHSYERAAQIREALVETDGLIAGLEADLAGLHRVGISITEMQGKIFSQRNEFHQLFHSVEVEKVRAGTASVQAALAEVATKVDTIHADLSSRKLWGGIAVVLLVVAGVLCLLLRKTYHDEESS
jgi:hypothetical protein